MDTTDTLIDTLFDGRYRIRRKVGSGGMANVYLADDETLGRPVAIKVLDARHSSDHAFVERFLREASSAARLNHPNIVQVYDRGEAGGTYYIAMEYVDGLTLKELIRRRGALTEQEVLAYGKQAASALRFAHRNGIVHRDVKPHNMMVDGEGRLKIADFGIARAGADAGLTEVGSIVGTAQYLSPEQAQGKTVAATSDLYSLGVVLFEMATGRVPFEGDSPVNVALRHVNEEPPRAGSLAPGISSALESIITRSLSKDPALRYQTADELLDDIELARQGTVSSQTAAMTRVIPGLAATGMAAATTSVQPMTPPVRMDATSSYASSMGEEPATEEPPRKRRRWVWVLVLVLVALAGGGVAWALTSGKDNGAEVAQKVVPDVVGLTESKAFSKLKTLGFDPQVDDRTYSTDVAAGHVISSDQAGGSKADEGATVHLVISRGIKPATMPDLAGDTRGEAREALRKAGIDPSSGKVQFEEEFSDQKQGTVIDQDPAAGESVTTDTAITITLSKGVETTTVPDVTGQDVTAATSRLEGEGFTVKTVQQDSSSQEGTVLSQDPPAGADADNGATVTLTVASGYNTVPDVVGMTPEDADAAIQDAGFIPQVASEVDDPAMSPGDPDQVQTLSPAKGHRAKLGSTVSYVVHHAPVGP